MTDKTQRKDDEVHRETSATFYGPVDRVIVGGTFTGPFHFHFGGSASDEDD